MNTIGNERRLYAFVAEFDRNRAERVLQSMAAARRLCFSRPAARYSLVLLNTPSTATLYPRLRAAAEYSVVADGAANVLLPLFHSSPSLPRPSHIIGDFDSVDPAALGFFSTSAVVHMRSQDYTDFQKSVEVLKGLGITGRVVVVAGMFGRVDHTLANFSVLFENADIEIVLVDESNTSCALMPGETEIEVSPQWTKCGLIPFERCVVTTTGLKWNLSESVMEIGGLVSSSNEATASVVTVRTTGKLLWTAETL